jgi:hypothetical protein
VRAAALVAAFTYFLAGVQKLRYSGTSWVFGDNMRWILYEASVSDKPKTDVVSLFVADRLWMSQTAAACLLLLELAAPFLLPWRRTRLLLLVAAVGLHAMTYVTLGIDYWGWILTMIVLLLPWDGIGGRRIDAPATNGQPGPPIGAVRRTGSVMMAGCRSR